METLEVLFYCVIIIAITLFCTSLAINFMTRNLRGDIRVMHTELVDFQVSILVAECQKLPLAELYQRLVILQDSIPDNFIDREVKARMVKELKTLIEVRNK